MNSLEKCPGSGWDTTSGIDRYGERDNDGFCTHCGHRVKIVITNPNRRWYQMANKIVIDHYRLLPPG